MSVETYFIRAGNRGPIKIGVSSCVAARISSLQCGSAIRLRLIGTIDGDVEQEMHRRFSRLRTHGEWFSSGNALLLFIERCIRSGKMKPPATRATTTKKPAQARVPLVSREEMRKRLKYHVSRLLIEKGFTTCSFAAKYGICRRQVARVAAGDVDPSLSLAATIAMSLGVKPEDIAAPLPNQENAK